MKIKELQELNQLADLIAKKVANEITSTQQSAGRSADDDTERLRDRFQLAQHLGISVSSLDRMVREGKISTVRIGRRVLFDMNKVAEELASSIA